MREARSAEEYKAALAEAKEQGKLLVAKFFTSDCYVCKSIFPKIRAAARDNPDVLWVKLNGSDPEMVDLFKALDIRKVPYFHMVRDGELVSELTASLNPEKLAVFRAELAAHKPAAVKELSSGSSRCPAA
ncbi:thioredoxin domain-containing protein [Haematococcus lacustris]|uniref:Thioredoxin domain-containing protein n=1 Tax=Haematococcus lacustris TaxID=44745 RepID=A0A699YQJ6_HAELA|nr:thioredoxin domain-containing protein [Haematococcus lacustris]